MSSLPTDVYDRDDLNAFLTEYGAVLGAGDLQAVSERFAFPALMVGPQVSTLVSDPEIVHDDLLWADVRWSYRDENASEGASERVRYLLRRGRETFEICVVVPVD